jgi:hypothetical protein
VIVATAWSHTMCSFAFRSVLVYNLLSHIVLTRSLPIVLCSPNHGSLHLGRHAESPVPTSRLLLSFLHACGRSNVTVSRHHIGTDCFSTTQNSFPNISLFRVRGTSANIHTHIIKSSIWPRSCLVWAPVAIQLTEPKACRDARGSSIPVLCSCPMF